MIVIDVTLFKHFVLNFRRAVPPVMSTGAGAAPTQASQGVPSCSVFMSEVDAMATGLSIRTPVRGARCQQLWPVH